MYRLKNNSAARLLPSHYSCFHVVAFHWDPDCLEDFKILPLTFKGLSASAPCSISDLLRPPDITYIDFVH